MPRSRLAPAAALGAALAATVTTMVLSPAVAGGGFFVTGQLASAAALSPGSQRTAAVEVTNGRDHPVDLRLRVEDVVEDEGGCLRQEGDVPGEECEGDGGELGRDLWLGVEREGQLLWQGGIDDLRGGVDLATLPAGETWDLDVTTGLDVDSPNDTMTDTARFTTVFVATATAGEPGDVEVAGVQTQVSGGTGGSGAGPGVPTVVDAGLRVPLPLGEASIGLWTLTGGLAVVLGCLGLALRRRSAQKVCSGPGNVPARTSSL